MSCGSGFAYDAPGYVGIPERSAAWATHSMKVNEPARQPARECSSVQHDDMRIKCRQR
jgi:hypothetical protein